MKACIPKDAAAKLRESVVNGEIGTEEIAKMLPEEKKALKEILESFVADKLNIGVSTEELQAIKTKAKAIDTAQKKLGDSIGDPTKLNENLEFFKAKKDMEDYLSGQSPASKAQILTGTIGRGMMLASIKSPILNIGSNIEIGVAEAITRRLANGTFRGADNKLATDYIKMVKEIYKKTGFDVSRMVTLSDSGMGGERVLGSTIHAQGPGSLRKAGRVVEDVVFKQMMGAPDVAFAAAHFADSVNLKSLQLAKGNKKIAREFMQDAMLLEPKTPEGELLRSQAILDAEKATWTDKSWASTMTEKIRRVFNDVVPEARVGDYLFPFVKTPSNVIATGIDYAGAGIPKSLIKTVQAIKEGKLGSKEHFSSMMPDLVRSGLGLTGAVAIVANLGPDNFMGAYDPNRSQIEQLRNSNYNAIRVGNKWISTDWLGPLSVPVTAMMYAQKYGNTPQEKAFQYGKGIGSAVMGLPVISDIVDSVKSYTYKKNQTLEEMTGEAKNYLYSQIYSRLVPSIVSDIAGATDKYERVTGKGIQAMQAKIPGLRQKLPIKTNIFGEEIKTESPLSKLIFGARVKTAKDTAITNEIVKLSDETGKSINFTDLSKSSSATVSQFRQKMGEAKMQGAKIEYGKILKRMVEQEINSSKYKQMNNEEKVNALRAIDTKAMKQLFTTGQYRFTYQRKK